MAFDWSNIEERTAVAIEAMMLPGPPGTQELEPRIMGVLRSLESEDAFPDEGKRMAIELIAILSPLQGEGSLQGIGPERRKLVVEGMMRFLRYVAHQGRVPLIDATVGDPS